MPLSPVARGAIEELKSLGVDNLTPDEIIRLHELGEAQMACGNAEGGVPVEPPIRVGNITLHPLTLAAADFVDRWIESSAPRNLVYWAIPYALSNSRNPSAFENIITEGDLRSAIKLWRKSAACTRSELDEACDQLMRSRDEEPDESSAIGTVCDLLQSVDGELAEKVRSACDKIRHRREGNKQARPEFARWRKLAAELGALTGVSPDYWLREDRNIALICLRRVQELSAIRLGACGVEQKASPELIRAIAAMRKEIAHIKEIRDSAKQSNG